MSDDRLNPGQFSDGNDSNRIRKPVSMITWITWGLVVAAILIVSSSVVISKYTVRDGWDSICVANLRGIGQALYVYARDDSRGMFPDESLDWKKILLDENNVAANQFRCPFSTSDEASYFYVPGYGTSSDYHQVIAYEYPIHRGGVGGQVLFQDGHVELVRAPNYQTLINSLKLPDGRPWAPHLATKK